MSEELVLTPTEDLVMEVLAARYRLGENIWTFDSRHARTLARLADRDLVRTMHGMVEKSVRASMTQKGIEAYIDEHYVPPIARKA